MPGKRKDHEGILRTDQLVGVVWGVSCAAE